MLEWGDKIPDELRKIWSSNSELTLSVPGCGAPGDVKSKGTCAGLGTRKGVRVVGGGLHSDWVWGELMDERI